MPSRKPFRLSTVSPSLRWSVVDAILHGLMVGSSESYFGALAVELGHRDFALAVLITLPPLAGALFQPFASILAAHLGSRRRLVLAGATLQALSHVAFIAIVALQITSFWPLLFAKLVFWIGALVGVPAWSDWMSALTKDVPRERYFARRSMFAHVALLFGFVGAGALLYQAQNKQATLPAFAVLCAVGLVARLGSVFALSRQQDNLPPPRRTGTRKRMYLALTTSRWRVAVYVALLTFGTFIAAPLFTPYMLRDMNLSYAAYAAVLATGILAKALAFPLVSRAAERFGLRPVLAVAGAGASTVPLLFILSTSASDLVAAHVVSGITWAGIELASFQLLLASAEDDLRTEFLSLSNGLTGVLQLSGGLVGGLLMQQVGLSYSQVFMVSTACRIVPLILLFGAVSHAMLAGPLPQLIMRIVSVRPGGGVVRRPVLPDTTDRT